MKKMFKSHLILGYFCLFACLLCSVDQMMASHMLGECSTTELHLNRNQKVFHM